MRFIKSSALGGVALLATLLSAQAQNFVPQIGLTTGYLSKNTYSAAFVGLVPAAAATDVVCIAGSAGKIIRLSKVVLTGSAGTMVGLPVSVVRRILVNTGGTVGTTTANPANNVALLDTAQPAATAVLVSYTANPTNNDVAPVYASSDTLVLPTTAAPTGQRQLIFDYGLYYDTLAQNPTLRGANQQFCLNFGGATVTAGLLNGYIKWTEE